MLTIRSTVHTTRMFDEIANVRAALALREAAELGANVSRQLAGQRPGPTGDMQNITVEGPRGTANGWEVEVVSHAYWAWFQEFGTLGSRRRKLKQPARSRTSSGRAAPSREPGTGITPLHFLGHGLTAARRALPDLLAKHLG